MENKKISILLAKEAVALFKDLDPDLTKNIEFNTALNSGEIVKYTYIHNPDFIVFNVSGLSEDSYLSLSKLKSESNNYKYHLLFIHSREEARDIATALREGVNQYQLKLFELVQKNTDILNFMELRQNREEMQVVYSELKKATLEVKKKNKQLQIAINNLEKLTLTDYLTGAYNRRYILEHIKQEIIRFKRNKRAFSFVLCDIDNFKKINDSYGHAFGDQVLVDTAKFLCETCREMDILSRWGGDEFLFLLPETDLNGAVIFSERARKSLEEKVFDYDHTDFRVSLTFGVSEYNESDGVNESIKNADNALLKGKSSGRNMVMAFKEIKK